jgi:hypothetical protein
VGPGAGLDLADDPESRGNLHQIGGANGIPIASCTRKGRKVSVCVQGLCKYASRGIQKSQSLFVLTADLPRMLLNRVASLFKR